MRTSVVKHHTYYGDRTIHITIDEALRKLHNGEATAILRRHGANTELIGTRATEPERLRECDPCSITCSEIITNAMASIGLAKSKTVAISDSQKLDENIEPDFVELATSKVYAWPGVFDRKAVGVRPADDNLRAKLFAPREPTAAEKIAASRRLAAFA